VERLGTQAPPAPTIPSHQRGDAEQLEASQTSSGLSFIDVASVLDGVARANFTTGKRRTERDRRGCDEETGLARAASPGDRKKPAAYIFLTLAA